jgi:dolichol-phosphate mannosyltransferase
MRNTKFSGFISRHAHKFMLFVLGGGLGFLINLGITYALTEFMGIWYMVSYTAGAIVNVAFNFLFHLKVTFKRKGYLRRRFAYFLIATAVVFCISWISVFAATEVFGLHYLVSIVLVTAAVSLINFLLNKFWVFKDWK